MSLNQSKNKWLFCTANYLHIDTKKGVVLRDLLFKEGDVSDERKLAESEQVPRSRDYLNRVSITTEQQADGQVLVKDAHEVWTLYLTAKVSRSGGEAENSIGFRDSNFLGYGKTVEISHNEEDAKDSNCFECFDPNTG